MERVSLCGNAFFRAPFARERRAGGLPSTRAPPGGGTGRDDVSRLSCALFSVIPPRRPPKPVLPTAKPEEQAAHPATCPSGDGPPHTWRVAFGGMESALHQSAPALRCGTYPHKVLSSPCPSRSHASHARSRHHSPFSPQTPPPQTHPQLHLHRSSLAVSPGHRHSVALREPLPPELRQLASTVGGRMPFSASASLANRNSRHILRLS